MGSNAGFQITDGSFNIMISNPGASSDSGRIRIGGGFQNSAFIAGIRGVTTEQAGGDAVFVDSEGQLGTASCGTYVPATLCPLGDVDGPPCDRVPAGSFCEADEAICDGDDDLNNCGGFDWLLRTD
jgi:hypothetical protein